MDKKYFVFSSLVFVLGVLAGMGITDKSLFVKSNDTSSGVAKNTEYTLPANQTITCQAGDTTIVTKVIDADTVVIEGGEHIRLLGIDADEKNYPCYEPAKLRLESLVLNKKVRLEKDVTDLDQYGRCLRTMFLGSENINLQLVKEGLAVARFYAPDIKYKVEISAAEKQAIENKIGCKWSSLK